MGSATKAPKRHDQVDWIVEAMIRMIRPVVSCAIGRVSCGALVDLVRKTYVEEARDYLVKQGQGRRVTRSALALLCGLDGRVIQNIEDNPSRGYSAADICSEAAIIKTWHTDPEFIDPASGSPAELPINGPMGTLQRLARRAAGRSVTAGTAVDCLKKRGYIAVTQDGTHVQLTNRHRMPAAGWESGSHALSRQTKTSAPVPPDRRAASLG